MDTLPAELKQHICDVLDYEDLKAIRFVNKKWAHVAALYLFIKITITPLSLDRLRLIAQHEVIAACIKEVVFYADLLPSIPPEMWHEELIRRTRTWTMEEESFRFQNYVVAYREQQRLRENNHKLSREIVDFSIPMLRRLQSLRLSTAENFHLCEDVDDVIDNESCLNKKWSEVWADLRRHALDKDGASQRDFEISTQFINLLHALATSGVHIRKLSLWEINLSVWQSGLQLRREPYCVGLKTLTTFLLETFVFFPQLDSTADGTSEVRALGMLLEGAQSLQTLNLHGYPSDHSRIDLLHCFRPALPKLSKLSLFGITTTEQNLIETLQGFRATLTRLDLKFISLTDRNTGRPTCSWYQFFAKMPESLPHLLELHLRHLEYRVPGPRRRWSRSKLESSYLKAVEHAIMSRTDMPQST